MAQLLNYLPSMDYVQFADWVIYFLFYGFLGWLVRSIRYSISNKKFTNTGFLTGPISPTTGFEAIIILIISQNIAFKNNAMMLLTLFFAIFFVGTALNQLGNKAEGFFTKLPVGRNIKARKSAQIIDFAITAAVYAMIAMLFIFLIQPSLNNFVQATPSVQRRSIVSLLILVLIADYIFSGRSLYHFSQSMQDTVKTLDEGEKTEEIVDQGLQKWQDSLPWNQKRFLFAFPKTLPTLRSKILGEGQPGKTLKERLRSAGSLPENKKSFASGLNFYKLLWVFIIASVIGFTVESLFCFVANGIFESRQGLLYGPFSQIYGFGACLMMLCVYPIRNKKPIWIFLTTAIIGGLFEAVASVIQQRFFGSVSWTYAKPWELPILGGRTCILFMLGWGAMGLVFIRYIYPYLSQWIEEIPNNQGRTLSWVLFAVLLIDGLLSIAAVRRWDERQEHIPATTGLQKIVDDAYPDSFMEQIYPNMVHQSTLEPKE